MFVELKSEVNADELTTRDRKSYKELIPAVLQYSFHHMFLNSNFDVSTTNFIYYFNTNISS